MKNKKNKTKMLINKQQNILVKKIYDNIFKLDTETLSQHCLAVYKELISRKDFNDIEDLIFKFDILRDELKERGVDITCLM